MTAYELLDGLAAAGLGSQPPVVYRALDFLVANGFAHRIERLGAFAACTLRRGGAQRGVPDLPRLPAGGRDVAARGRRAGSRPQAAAAGFAIERTVVEAEGLCARCREAAA